MSFLTQKIHKKNNTKHNIFDLSNNVNTLIAPGMLLPLRTDEVLPSDTYKFRLSAFAKTLQMVVPSFVRCRAHIDSFFVPFRLLGTDIPDIIVGNTRGVLANYNNKGAFIENNPTLPFIKGDVLLKSLADRDTNGYTDDSGAVGSEPSILLLNALGYGVGASAVSKAYSETLHSRDTTIKSRADATLNVVSTSGNIDLSACTAYNTLAPQAYQKIYQDYYRNKLWEKENKASYFAPPSRSGQPWSSEEINTLGLFEMRYHDFDKDRIVGIVPDENGILSDGISAYAQDVVSGLMNGLDDSHSLGSKIVPTSDTQVASSSSVAQDTDVTVAASDKKLVSSTSSADYSAMITRFNALSIRRLQAMQKFAEITDLNKSDYKHQISAHFGFTPDDLNSDYCQYIGGADIPLQVSDVDSTTPTDDFATNLLGYSAGKGVFYQPNTQEYSYSVKEHGVVMHIMYLLPEVDYFSTFTERLNMRLNRYDFCIPEFDSFGFEPVRLLDLYNTAIAENPTLYASDYNPFQIFGYLPRYWHYKTKLDSNSSVCFQSNNQTFAPRYDALNYNSYIVNFPYQRFFACAIQGSVTFQGFKCPSWILDNLFAVSSVKFKDTAVDDPFRKYQLILNQMQFIFHVHFDVTVSRCLSVDGLPY